jgi:beta-glucosidase
MAMSLRFEDALARARDGESVGRLAELLLAQLNLDEKLTLLDGDVPFYPGMKILATGGYSFNPWVMGEISRLGVPGIRFTDGPRGIVTETATCFPVSYARGATWDTLLEERVGRAIGLEGRARGANFFGGVCINLPRHPAWGRSQETYGEDPILLGRFGVAITRGVQENLVACVKHFALNSIENARFKVNVTVDDSALHEVYLPHFKRVVQEAGALAVMSAYNAVNGEWCGENKALLQDILRDQWGFKGLTISDFVFGVHDAVRSLRNGLDIEAPLRHRRAYTLPSAVKKGLITEFHLDRAGARILATELEICLKRTSAEPESDVVFCEAHRRLAREVAARSMVLVKNNASGSNRPMLPLDATATSYAVIGRLANRTNTGDHGSSDVRCPEVINPYEGFRAAAEAHGGTVTLSTSDDVEDAIAVASKSNVAIIIAGNSAADEGELLVGAGLNLNPPWPSLVEVFRDILPSLWSYLTKGASVGAVDKEKLPGNGGDRASLRLRKKEIDIIRAVSNVNPQTVVVVISGGPVIVEPWISSVAAVLFAWYSGTEGGTAVADILFGRTDASGRLPSSIPSTEQDLPFFDANASEITYNKWHGQRLLDRDGKVASFPLGFGLSYTTFSLSDATLSQASNSFEDYLSVWVKVINTGNRSGRHIVQVYGRPLPAQNDFPHRLLLGFAPVDLEPSEATRVEINASLQPMKRWRDGSFFPVTPDMEIEIGSYSGDPNALRVKHTW